MLQKIRFFDKKDLKKNYCPDDNIQIYSYGIEVKYLPNGTNAGYM
jgi:hypothetical protein